MAPKHDALSEYARKRTFSATPEPRGRTRRSAKVLHFVIQMHRASRLHYDFRLEAGGVLASWAIPKGPTRDPAQKRLAMHVEDHPYEYRTFEGIIPAGNYGAGEVIVWDEGTYTLAEGTDPVHEIAKGAIKFILNGKKLRGMFTLVKIKPRSDESGEPWLLIKDRDAFVDATWGPADEPHSARSSLPRDPAPMLATLVDAPFDDPKWLFEIKWDGYRAIASIGADGRVDLRSRTGKALLGQFPELSDIGRAFRSLPVAVDGEICALDATGRSSFGALQARDRRDGYTLVFVAFDCLYANGRDLREETLDERKARLEALIVDGHGVMYSKHVIGKGKDLFALVQQQGLEGIVGKLRAAPYRSARSREWVKIKAKQQQEFVVGGYTEPTGSRKGFGALLVGYYHDGALIFAGSVGTGFDQAALAALAKRMAPLSRKTSPFTGEIESNAPPHFVRPQIVVEVAFAEWTRDERLRQPVYLGVRDDKLATDVVREDQVSIERKK
jgi:bifunctional non-homologous end joining protein LigD